MPTIIDKEFGTITLRRSAKASAIRIRVAPNGEFRASMPLYTPVFMVRRLLNSSRLQLRELRNEHRQSSIQLTDGMQIGKSHTLVVRSSTLPTHVTRHGQQIILSLHAADALSNTTVEDMVRKVSIDALRIEAKSYLPKRLAFLASQHGYTYTKVRFSHASGRWGSCSSNGTISLNIALMKLPFELIDYVLIHELCHTKQMNHSEQFWKLVATSDPAYKNHRTQLKKEAPSI